MLMVQSNESSTVNYCLNCLSAPFKKYPFYYRGLNMLNLLIKNLFDNSSIFSWHMFAVVA